MWPSMYGDLRAMSKVLHVSYLVKLGTMKAEVPLLLPDTRNRDADIENKHMVTKGGKSVG